MGEKILLLTPELILFAGVVVVSVLGLSRNKRRRDLLPLVTAVFLGVACIATPLVSTDERVAAAGLLMPRLGVYVKMLVCMMGVILAMLGVRMVDRRMEAAVDEGRAVFDPIRANRGEYFAFFLLSLIGVMLCCGAPDLIWLFLALELTSLPTYIMVAMSRGSRKAQEAAVKYFFLGAMAAGFFLYGFALLYGATGSIQLDAMRDYFVTQRATGADLPIVASIGLIMAILGISFKIAAAPMHFYAADVYEGAASPVTAFLGFVPKTAGIVALMLLLSTVGWEVGGTVVGLPRPVTVTLWMISILTMTLGNIGALLQTSAKRMLAYSSIAHSGYMLIGVIAGPGLGFSSVLFYLLSYGVMNTAAFAVLAGLERRGYEIESMADLAGLRERHPTMAIVMVIAAGSLLGFPPLLGFVGKLYLFIAGVSAGHIALVVIAAVNSAISAWYYLRLAGLPILAKPTPQGETITSGPTIWPRIAAICTAAAIVVVPFFSRPLMRAGSIAAGDADAAAVTTDENVDPVARQDDPSTPDDPERN